MSSRACRPKSRAARGRARVRAAAAVLVAAALMVSVARAALPGAIVGVVRNTGNAPVAGVTVTALRADGEAIRATVSGSDGVFSFADLPPGSWSLTLDAGGDGQAHVGALGGS